MGIQRRKPLESSKAITLVGDTETTVVNIFEFAGVVLVERFIAIVREALSSDLTDVHLEAFDGTNHPDISLATGLTLSDAPVGSSIKRTGVAAAVLDFDVSDQARLQDAQSAGNGAFTPFILTAKAGVTNYLRLKYTTGNAASGVLACHVDYCSFGEGGTIRPVT